MIVKGCERQCGIVIDRLWGLESPESWLCFCKHSHSGGSIQLTSNSVSPLVKWAYAQRAGFYFETAFLMMVMIATNI